MNAPQPSTPTQNFRHEIILLSEYRRALLKQHSHPQRTINLLGLDSALTVRGKDRRGITCRIALDICGTVARCARLPSSRSCGAGPTFSGQRAGGFLKLPCTPFSSLGLGAGVLREWPDGAEGGSIWIETPVPRGCFGSVQGSRRRAFRWFWDYGLIF